MEMRPVTVPLPDFAGLSLVALNAERSTFLVWDNGGRQLVIVSLLEGWKARRTVGVTAKGTHPQRHLTEDCAI